MNLICLYYICREEGKPKQNNSVAFHNPLKRTEEDVDVIIRKHLFHNNRFIHSRWEVPDLHSEKPETSALTRYHEYMGVKAITETFQEEITNVEDFLERVKKSRS